MATFPGLLRAPLRSGRPRRNPDPVKALCRKAPRRYTSLVLSFVLLVFWAAMLGGCSKKISPTGLPFDLDKIFSPRPDSGEDLTEKERGVRLAKEKLYTEALKAFKAHVIERPEDFSGFNAIAVCYKNLGDPSQAIANYERALEFAVSPADRAKVLANIGHLYFGEERYQVALGYYREAHSEFERNPLYLVFIARTLVRLGEGNRARKVLREAEKVQADMTGYDPPDNKGLGYYLMADSYLTLKDYPKFLDHFERAIRVNPTKYSKWLTETISAEDGPLREIENDPKLKKIVEKYGVRTIRSSGPSGG